MVQVGETKYMKKGRVEEIGEGEGKQDKEKKTVGGRKRTGECTREGRRKKGKE